METEKTGELLSEAATAKFAEVTQTTLRAYRKSGKIKPVHEVAGVAVLYDACAVREFFMNCERYQVAKARRKGEFSTVAA